MTDTFIEVTNESWFSRIKNAFVGVLVGLVFFVGAFPLLTWNEKRSIDRTRALNEAATVTTTVDPAKLDPEHEGKAVHFTGLATTASGVKDETFGIAEPALKLQRMVEMYQWKEDKETSTNQKTGGSSETTTTYRYTKGWADEAISSSEFRHPEGHQNPPQLAFPNSLISADAITVGAYTLPDDLIGKIGEWEQLAPPAADKLPESVRDKAKESGNTLYFGADPANPALGDNRVSFKIIRPHDVSIVARQIGKTLEPFVTTHGSVSLLQDGVHSATDLFQAAANQNKLVTWLMRLGFFVLMALGLVMIFNPLKVIADVLPIAGSIVGAGTGAVAFLLAGALSSLTIAIAWLAFRPLIGVPLLVVTVGFLVLLRQRFGQGSPAPAAAK
jgi:hypothetical protein